MLIRLAHTARRGSLPSCTTDSCARLGCPQIKRQLGLTRYETALQMLHKLRVAMVSEPKQDRRGRRWQPTTLPRRVGRDLRRCPNTRQGARMCQPDKHGLIQEIPSCQELIDGIIKEAEEIWQSFETIVQPQSRTHTLQGYAKRVAESF